MGGQQKIYGWCVVVVVRHALWVGSWELGVEQPQPTTKEEHTNTRIMAKSRLRAPRLQHHRHISYNTIQYHIIQYDIGKLSYKTFPSYKSPRFR